MSFQSFLTVTELKLRPADAEGEAGESVSALPHEAGRRAVRAVSMGTHVGMTKMPKTWLTQRRTTAIESWAKRKKMGMELLTRTWRGRVRYAAGRVRRRRQVSDGA
jgi:hypothetical protein